MLRAQRGFLLVFTVGVNDREKAKLYGLRNDFRLRRAEGVEESGAHGVAAAISVMALSGNLHIRLTGENISCICPCLW
jgi:hypothetical protein